jgi:hypothetical protein
VIRGTACAAGVTGATNVYYGTDAATKTHCLSRFLVVLKMF